MHTKTGQPRFLKRPLIRARARSRGLMTRGCSAEMPVMHTEWTVILIGEKPDSRDTDSFDVQGGGERQVFVFTLNAILRPHRNIQLKKHSGPVPLLE